MDSPAILFGYLKYGSLLIFSSTWCIGSRNTVLTFCALVVSDCPVKSLFKQLLLYRSDLKSLLSWEITFSFPLPCNWSSSTRLYLSSRSISWHTLVAGLPVRDFLKPCSTGRLFLKVLMAHCQSCRPSHYTSPNMCPSKPSESLHHAWTTTVIRSQRLRSFAVCNEARAKGLG